MDGAARANKIKMPNPKADPSTASFRGKHAPMNHKVGDTVKMMVHGKVTGVHSDKYENSMHMEVHKVKHMKQETSEAAEAEQGG